MSPLNPGKAAILTPGKKGHSVSEIAGFLKLNRDFVHRTLKRGILYDPHRSGRPVSVAIHRL